MDETPRNWYSCNKIISLVYLRLLAVGMKLCASHLCKKIQSVRGAPNSGGPHAMEQLALWLIRPCCSRWWFPPNMKLIWPSTHSCCWYIKWPNNLDLWPFYFGQRLNISGHVINPSRPSPRLKILWLIRSSDMSYSLLLFHWHAFCSHCISSFHVICVWGQIFAAKILPHIWNPWSRFLYFATSMALRSKRIDLSAKIVYTTMCYSRCSGKFCLGNASPPFSIIPFLHVLYLKSRPSVIHLGGLGKCCKLLQQGSGRAPTANVF